VQTAHNGSKYNSTIAVRLSKAPIAGDVLVLFFEQNQSAAFPYYGQVTYPTTPSGTQWSYDGGTQYTAILHHVVQSGENGAYTLNVGGKGVGWADYMVAEVSGVSKSTPVNARLPHTVSTGATQYNFGSAGITPSSAGTFPIAFFGPHKNGLTWSSISSGWTIRDRNADFSEMLATGPVQTATAAVNATAYLSAGSTWPGAADVVLLNPSSTATTATPAPAPSTAPTVAPTAQPTVAPTVAPTPTATPSSSGSAYTYKGCRVYTANDWFTTNLVAGGSSYASNAIDANSAKIIANLNTAYPTLNFSRNTDPNAAAVNLATSSTPKATISGLAYGYYNDPWNDDPAPHTQPITSPMFQEGTVGCSGGDCHVITLNTQTCVVYETYGSGTSWNGSSYGAEGGGVHNLNYSYNQQIGYTTVTAADLPMFGTTDWGEEASGASINHAVAFYLGLGHKAMGGYVAPAAYGVQCTSYCTSGTTNVSLPYGARLRLHASYPCPSQSSYPQANLLCNQLKNYGMIFDDIVGVDDWAGIRLGLTSSGTNPWNSADYNQLLANIKITDFDVMALGTRH
jgi:hypothetical protein